MIPEYQISDEFLQKANKYLEKKIYNYGRNEAYIEANKQVNNNPVTSEYKTKKS